MASQDRPQWYGTNVRCRAAGLAEWQPVDTLRVSDVERSDSRDRTRVHYLADATAPPERRGAIDDCVIDCVVDCVIDCASGSNLAITVTVTSPQQAVESSQPPVPVHAPQFAMGAACVAEQAHRANALPVFGVASN